MTWNFSNPTSKIITPHSSKSHDFKKGAKGLVFYFFYGCAHKFVLIVKKSLRIRQAGKQDFQLQYKELASLRTFLATLRFRVK